jgi:hypothetical protein
MWYMTAMKLQKSNYKLQKVCSMEHLISASDPPDGWMHTSPSPPLPSPPLPSHPLLPSLLPSLPSHPSTRLSSSPSLPSHPPTLSPPLPAPPLFKGGPGV